jgi:hypothetical protein
MAVRGLREASKTFKISGNPWLAEALLQKAQTLIKAGNLDAAEKELGEARQEAERIETNNPEEAHVVRKDVDLTRIWLEIRRASDPATHDRASKWLDCMKLAEKLYDEDRLPPRLLAEKALQYGRTLTHVKGEEAKGLGILGEARELARRDGRRKIELAALLAMAENLTLQGRFRDANDRLAEANLLRVKARTSSTFLEDWERSISDELGATMALGIFRADLTEPHETLIEKLNQAYGQFNWEMAERDGVQFQKRTGMHRSWFFRLGKRKAAAKA